MPPKASKSQKRRAQSPEPPPKRVKSTVRRPRKQAAGPIIENKAPTTRLDVYVFGEGSSGELGLGPKNSVDVKRPRLNHLLDAEKVGVVQLAAGGMHVAALTFDGKVLTWGVNDNYALGRDTSWEGGLKDLDAAEDDSGSDTSDIELNPHESTPIAIPEKSFSPGTKIVSVTAGNSATFALTQEGHVYGWGTFVNKEGKSMFMFDQAGKVIEKQKTPVLIPGLEKIVQISAGSDFCLALDADGTVHSWGLSEQDQLGRRLVVGRHQGAGNVDFDILHNRVGLTPGLVALPKRKKIVSIHAASNHAFAIDSDGNAWAWGLNNFSQTGVKTGAGTGGNTIFIPQKLQALAHRKMKILDGGSHHSIGVSQEGECLVWGRMDGAQMGLDIKSLPVDDPTKVLSERGRPRVLLEPTVLPIPDCVYAAAGSDQNIAITSQGKAYSWGFNTNYQCGQGADLDDVNVPTLIDNTAVRDKKLTWAGSGGQYSMLAGPHQPKDGPQTNGVGQS
ncbi:Ran exchange factor Prp20/Pim1, putative [Paecilomyces variotii No. 5]|uniref:Ran exchange factor Prp20/Pim1, putative n=1 Tax=Byssochlamys spectabilis (strain No. 5 / NBRC 109023) TaxID=1356009 RepID=V5I5S6_BYSSN|nr:Ran exchange factor Prp20/Pim1, putative [Paecilomyces variotii No. 5]